MNRRPGMQNMEKLKRFAKARMAVEPTQAAVTIVFDPAEYEPWSVLVPWVAEGSFRGYSQEVAAGRAVKQAEVVAQRESEVPDA